MPDPYSFAAGIAAKYGHRLRRFLSVRSRNMADVPDLAQEVFLRLMRIEHYEAIRSPEAYLFTVASHVLHQHSLRQTTTPASIDITEALTELQLISHDDPSQAVDLQNQIESLQRTLAQLPPKLATTLLLHRYAGFSIEEIANQLGVKRATAKNYLAQALAYCRNAHQETE